MAELDTLVEKLNSQLVNKSVEQPLMTYQDNTSRDPITRSEVGNKIKARGSATIESFVNHEGEFEKITLPNGQNFWYANNLKVTYKYTSSTHGERWIYPGGVFVDNVWNELHPTGTVTFIFNLEVQKNGTIGLNVTIDAGHEDRPGHFVRDHVVVHFRQNAIKAFQDYTGVEISSS
ncbi:hypothetical protein [Bacillus sp. BR3(2024)]|uniref:hypothetical protein n=1 Tax=Bacillus sp. BR3(2024) TaxID=3126755 RepID=UPI003182DC7B